MWQNLELRCLRSCWLITHMNFMTDTWAVLGFPVDLQYQRFLLQQTTAPRCDGLLLEACLSRKMVQSLLFIKNPNQLFVRSVGVMPWSDSYISSNKFFISCPDQMFSVLLKYCKNTMVMDRKWWSINLNLWMLIVLGITVCMVVCIWNASWWKKWLVWLHSDFLYIFCQGTNNNMGIQL